MQLGGPETSEFLDKLYTQMDEVAAGGNCHFDAMSPIQGNEVVIVLTPMPKEGKLPRGIGANL